jgi:hypothetical protein
LPPQFSSVPATTKTKVAGTFEAAGTSTAKCGTNESAIGGGAALTGPGSTGEVTPSLAESSPTPKPAAGKPSTEWLTEVFQQSSGELETKKPLEVELQAFVMCTPTPPIVEFEEITTAAKREV